MDVLVEQSSNCGGGLQQSVTLLGPAWGNLCVLLASRGPGQAFWLNREVRCAGGYARPHGGCKKLKGDAPAR